MDHSVDAAATQPPKTNTMHGNTERCLKWIDETGSMIRLLASTPTIGSWRATSSIRGIDSDESREH